MFAATVGFFDGVHAGHSWLISQVRQTAGARGLTSLVVTFDRHPREVFDPSYVPSLLTTTHEKLPLLRLAGAEEIRVLRFDKGLRMLSAQRFVRMLREDMGVRTLVMGYDHRFGHDGAEVSDYEALARAEGVELVRATRLPGAKASSSAVRRLLMAGEVGEANRLLGRRYGLGGRVVHGRGVGRSLGFPTANVEVPKGKLVPAGGAYAVIVALGDGERHAGMLNIGNRPTMGDGGAVSVEVCLLGYEGDLYGDVISMELVARLREERRFEGAEALAGQLRLDAERVRALLPSLC